MPFVINMEEVAMVLAFYNIIKCEGIWGFYLLGESLIFLALVMFCFINLAVQEVLLSDNCWLSIIGLVSTHIQGPHDFHLIYFVFILCLEEMVWRDSK